MTLLSRLSALTPIIVKVYVSVCYTSYSALFYLKIDFQFLVSKTAFEVNNPAQCYDQIAGAKVSKVTT